MSNESCVIGQNTTIKGNIKGDQSLVVAGHVEGSISLSKVLTVKSGGSVIADTRSEQLVVEGELVGNVQADSRVDISASGKLIGSIRAAKVSIADGAKFKGFVDMEVDLPNVLKK